KGYFFYIGRRNTIKSCGYVGDFIDSMCFALDRPERSILYNFAYPTRHTIEEIVEAFRLGAAHGAPKLTVPGGLAPAAPRPFRGLAGVGVKSPIHRDRVRKLYESTNIVPAWLTGTDFVFRTDLESGLRSWQAQSHGPGFR